jgi:hypothetical protein
VDAGFQVRGAHLKKLRRAEGGAKMFGVFRVKNHDFTPKNLIFSNFRGGVRRVRPLYPPLYLRTIWINRFNPAILLFLSQNNILGIVMYYLCLFNGF